MSLFRIPRLPLPAGLRHAVGRLGHAARHIGARMWNNVWLSGGLIVTIVGLGVGLSIALSWQSIVPPPPLTVSRALEELDIGNFEVARAMADELRLRTDLAPDEQGTPSYILGIVLAQEIEREWRRKERAGLQTLATGYLEEARQRGYPAGRAVETDLLLGKLYFNEGRFAESLPPFSAALAALPEEATQIHRYLSDAYLRSSDPDWPAAQRHLLAFLADANIGDEARATAEMDLARTHFELGNLTECEAILKQVSVSSSAYPEALMLRGRVLMREADELGPTAFVASTVPEAALAKYVAADVIFEELAANASKRRDLVRQARYLQAICLLRQGKHDEAEQQLVNLRQSSFNTHEGLAGALAFAELQQAQGRDEDAMIAFRSVATQAGEMNPYENRWIPMTQLRKRLEHAHQQYLDKKQFKRALVIAEGLASIVPLARSVELSANAERDWGRELDLQAQQVRLADRGELVAQSRATWMRAGMLYERLARLRFSTRQFPEDVWNSADCYYQAQEYEHTAKLVKLYMKNETRRNRPPALARLGEAELAMGKPEEALKWLTECIQFFPKDPHSYRARIVAAKANQELGKLDAAKQLLIGNLEHSALTPRSPEWRESKFQFGRILHQQGIQHEAQSRLKGVKDPNANQRKEGLRELELARDAFQLAIQHLQEAVQRDELADRDPFEKETLEARYFIAEAHRQSAKFARRKLPTVTIETTRVTLNREMKKELNAAAEAYFDLQRMLNRKQEQSELTPMEMQLLRNCYFARADALYDLEKYDEARTAYSTATNRYQHEPESVEAYVQIANCYRRQGRPDDALGTLELAKVVLERIPDDADFLKTTRYTRDEWIVLLDWLTAL